MKVTSHGSHVNRLRQQAILMQKNQNQRYPINISGRDWGWIKDMDDTWLNEMADDKAELLIIWHFHSKCPNASQVQSACSFTFQ